MIARRSSVLHTGGSSFYVLYRRPADNLNGILPFQSSELSELPRDPRAVAGRRRPRVSTVTPARSVQTRPRRAHRVRAGRDGRGALREACTMV